MHKYVIMWDAGYGETYDIVEAEDESAADEIAYEQWRDEAEANANYGVVKEYEEGDENEY